MANQKISQLTNAAALTGTEQVAIVQSGVTVKTTTQDIANLTPATVVPKFVVYNCQYSMGNLIATQIVNTSGFALTISSNAANGLITVSGTLPNQPFPIANTSALCSNIRTGSTIYYFARITNFADNIQLTWYNSNGTTADFTGINSNIFAINITIY